MSFKLPATVRPGTLFTLLFAAAASLNAFAQSPVHKAERDEVFMVPQEDAAMKQAFQKARATLDGFLLAATKPAPGTSDYALKVAVSDGNSTEYFWVNDFKRNGDKFTGVLANEPRMVKTVKNGQRISFARERIVDWVYTNASQRRMFGNYTACALLARESASEAEKFKAHFGLKCD